MWGDFTENRWIPHTRGQLRGKYFHLMTWSCIWYDGTLLLRPESLPRTHKLHCWCSFLNILSIESLTIGDIFTEVLLYIYCRAFLRSKMNASPPVVVANPAAQGQHVLPVQQGVASQRQVVVIQAPSSPPLVMGSLQRGCVLGMGITQLAIGIFSFIFQIGAFIVPTSFTIYSVPGIWGGIFVSIKDPQYISGTCGPAIF